MAVAYNYSSTAGEYTLTSPVSSSATVLQLDSVTGLPAAPFKVVVDPGLTSEEIVKVSSVAGTTLTVVRGHDSSLAVAHSGLAKIRHMMTAEDLRLSRQHEDTATGVHGVTGAVVGTADAQALTNKDLSSPTNTMPSSVATLTGTQALTNKDLTSASNTFPSSLATSANLSAHTGATAAHGVTGAIVGTTDTQTLINKDLSAATNTFPSTLLTTTATQTVTNKDLSSSTNTFDTIRWGAVSCTSTTRPTTGNYTNRLIWETDTLRFARYNGTTWDYLTAAASGTWTTYTPTNSGVGVSTITGRWRKIDTRVDFEIYAVVAAAPTGTVLFGLPQTSASYNAGLYAVGNGILKDTSAGIYVSVTGIFQPNAASTMTTVELMVPASGTNTALTFISGTIPIPWAAGDTISIQGSYNV